MSIGYRIKRRAWTIAKIAIASYVAYTLGTSCNHYVFGQNNIDDFRTISKRMEVLQNKKYEQKNLNNSFRKTRQIEGTLDEKIQSFNQRNRF